MARGQSQKKRLWPAILAIAVLGYFVLACGSPQQTDRCVTLSSAVEGWTIDISLFADTLEQEKSCTHPVNIHIIHQGKNSINIDAIDDNGKIIGPIEVYLSVNSPVLLTTGDGLLTKNDQKLYGWDPNYMKSSDDEKRNYCAWHELGHILQVYKKPLEFRRAFLVENPDQALAYEFEQDAHQFSKDHYRQKLFIAKAGSSSPSSSSSGQGSSPTPTPAVSSGKTYIVQPGDTLYSIARRYGTTVEKIQAVNPIIKDINKIRPGWELVIPN